MDLLKDVPATIETLLLALAALVPGFVWYRASALFVTKARHPEKAWLLEILTRSCVVHAVSGGALYWIAVSGMHKTSPFWFVWSISGIIFGVPLALTLVGVLFAAVAFRIPPKLIRPAPEAWDFRFIRSNPCWVRARLKDGKCVGGYFGKLSAASSDTDKRDIFIEYAWEISENGAFLRAIPDTEGIWIRGDDVQMIEFLKDKSASKKKEKSDGQAAGRQDGEAGPAVPGSDSGQHKGPVVLPPAAGADLDGKGARAGGRPAGGPGPDAPDVADRGLGAGA